jgi:putative nucleotidyltransferase with HDIG domain
MKKELKTRSAGKKGADELTTVLERLVTNSNFDHSRQVARISEIIAEKLGYSETEISVIVQAALLHDVGKAAIPHEIINKPGALTPDEYAVMKTHAEAGCRQIMEAAETLTIAAAVAKQHHERLDGSGYFKISGGNIDPYAKLIAVADVFDALVSRRAYKEPWGARSAIEYLSVNGNCFDRQAVRCLSEVLGKVLELYQNKQSAL